MSRIYMSPPHMEGDEIDLVREAFKSNWITPLGPDVDALEEEFRSVVGVDHALALSSGTAALHLALRVLGVEGDDVVVCSDLTFVASASPVVYQGATPVFIDADRETWTMDPDLLAEELESLHSEGRLPKAAIVTDLFGQAADYDRIGEICADYSVPVVEDAAEALGASYRGKMAGSLGRLGVFSFNGNKIITTSGGGMLVSDDGPLIEEARHLSTQARDPAAHYQHSTIGYNYRLSNLLAALGRGQLAVLEERVRARRRNFEFYEQQLGDLSGVEFMPEAAYGRCNRWLTCITVDPEEFGATREDVRRRLEAEEIEARPIWKPMHLQPVFEGCRVRGGEVGRDLFERGLCLPSGSSLTESDLDRIVAAIRGVHER